MHQNLLIKHKRAEKRLEHAPAFKPFRRGRLPKPLDKMGGSRMFATDILPVSGAYHICFAWRSGELLSDTAFFAWLFLGIPGSFSPLAILHYHPSHKPAHLLTPCRDDRDFTNRSLPGVIEFAIARERFDPRQEADRERLVALFCRRCGVALGEKGGLLS